MEKDGYTDQDGSIDTDTYMEQDGYMSAENYSEAESYSSAMLDIRLQGGHREGSHHQPGSLDPKKRRKPVSLTIRCPVCGGPAPDHIHFGGMF